LADRRKINADSFVCYVDDGSRDKTWLTIQEIAQQEARVRGLKLSRNFGHQNPLLAGMLWLRDEVDCVVTIDADLQDDAACIEQMIDRYQEDCVLVYGVRQSRATDSFGKRWTAQIFYHVMEFMGVDTVYNHAEFRLASRAVLAELAKYGEINMFLRGIFPQFGFKSAIFSYDRKKLAAGETKFPLRKMLAFAWDGNTLFSGFPLRMIFLLGCVILVMSISLAVWALLDNHQGRSACRSGCDGSSRPIAADWPRGFPSVHSARQWLPRERSDRPCWLSAADFGG
jgi:glycosyltransferase involved in cell wall biosynthesis